MKDYRKKIRRASYARAALALESYLKKQGVDADLPEKAREELKSYLIPFPLSGYNGNDAKESGDISGE